MPNTSGVRKPTSEELSLINKNFSKRELKEDEIYVFDVFACDDNILTAYFSRLGTDMIEAFHRDVGKKNLDANGPIVGYLFGHNDQMIPSGTLFKSELVTENIPDGEGKSKVVQRFKPTVFMPKNLNVGGINTDDYIRAYEMGTTEDVSVGFMAASYICDICQYDIRDFWHCSHVPGRNYVTNEQEVENGATPITKQCSYTVHQGFFKDHNLMELSGVYRGAMWGARIESRGWSIGNDKVTQHLIEHNGKVLASTNIKDFRPNDILRFNYQFDGSIEKMGSIEGEGVDIEEYKKMENDLKEAIKEKTELNLKIEELSGRLLDFTKRLEVALCKTEEELVANKQLIKENEDLRIENARLKDEIKELTRVFALSQSDQVELKQKLDEANKEIERLGIELKHRVEEVDQYIADLRGRCKKLSIQINGQSFNEGFFDKEVLSLSVDELRQKISILEKQLAQMIKVGRLTVVTDKVHQGNLANNAPQNSKLFKIK